MSNGPRTEHGYQPEAFAFGEQPGHRRRPAPASLAGAHAGARPRRPRRCRTRAVGCAAPAPSPQPERVADGRRTSRARPPAPTTPRRSRRRPRPTCSPRCSTLGRLRPAPDRRRAPDGPAPRRARAARAVPRARRAEQLQQMIYAILTQKQREQVRGRARARPRLLRPRPGAVPRQRLPPARGRRRGLPPDPVRDQAARGPRRPAVGRRTSPACRAASCSSPARPAPASRRRSPSLVDLANRTRARPHHDGRGPDRVPAPPQELRWSTSARSARTRTRSPTRSSTCCARTPTSSWSARCATWRRSRSR